MMQWLMDRSKEHYGVVSVEELAFLQLGLIFAAVHTTSLTATNIIYTLAVTPEYIKPLREEIITAMSNNDGQVTTRALGQMVKLDSYMKEVMRLYPLGLSKSTPQKPHPTPN
jgi:cytochrome P450